MQIDSQLPSLSTYTSAQQGIQQGFERLNTNTQVIANPNSPADSVSKGLINNQLTSTEIEALVKALKT